MKPHLPYLKTLRRIPAPIIRAMATREIVPASPRACLCGWAIREALAFANGRTADEYTPDDFGSSLSASIRKFGGTSREWEALFYGICDDDGHFIDVETAFAIRVAECVK